MTETVITRVREAAESLLPGMGLELYEVQFRREGHGWVLRLIIDSEAGVTLDDCSGVSREIGDFLDVEDLIDHPYHLEVSSPGAERSLRDLSECRRFLEAKVRVKLRDEFEGQRVFVGMLEAAEDGEIVVVDEAERRYRFPWEGIKKVRLSL